MIIKCMHYIHLSSVQCFTHTKNILSTLCHMDFSFQNLSDFIKSTCTCIILLRRSRGAGTVLKNSNSHPVYSLIIFIIQMKNFGNNAFHNPTMKTVQVRFTVLIQCFRTDTLGKQQHSDHCVQYCAFYIFMKHLCEKSLF